LLVAGDNCIGAIVCNSLSFPDYFWDELSSVVAEEIRQKRITVSSAIKAEYTSK
jgi:hypothetical protein